jgi:hypothetical protein
MAARSFSDCRVIGPAVASLRVFDVVEGDPERSEMQSSLAEAGKINS